MVRWVVRVRRVLFALAVLALVVLAVRWSGAAESVFFYWPSRGAFHTPAGARDVEIVTEDGVKLHGWFIPAAGVGPGARGPAVLHVHGNAGNVADHAGFSDFLPRAGVSVLLFDYRGYGRSEGGRRTRGALVRDTEAAWRVMLSQPEVDPARVGVYGVSLGGAFAIELASRRADVRAVAAVSAFSSWSRVARDHGGWLGWALIANGMDAVNGVRRLGSRPLLVVHGDRDPIVRPYHADVLESAARGAGVEVKVVRSAVAEHNDIMEADGAVAAAVAGFFRGALGG